MPTRSREYVVLLPGDGIGPEVTEVALHVHTHVREDQLALFGFATPEELELFELLIQVDGVGPKVGLGILSVASVRFPRRRMAAVGRTEPVAMAKFLDRLASTL